MKSFKCQIIQSVVWLLVIVFQLTISAQTINEEANRLIQSYPDFIKAFYNDSITWYDKTRAVFDDGVIKSVNQLINSPDMQDMFHYDYPKKRQDFNKNAKCDPGRIRNEDFFKKMYGTTRKEVESNLTEIIWLPNTVNKKIRITKINNIDKKLQHISDELDTLPYTTKKFVTEIGGSYNWRHIAGTNRLSAHSFGIAIDINVRYANYWKWDLKQFGEFKYFNKIPNIIIEIFEKYGFIWGGKWYHYDTMHFEYRPELLFTP